MMSHDNHPHKRLNWRKTSYSINGSACVELATAGGGALLRDSKDPHGARLAVTVAELAEFIAACKAGEFDDLAAE